MDTKTFTNIAAAITSQQLQPQLPQQPLQPQQQQQQQGKNKIVCLSIPVRKRKQMTLLVTALESCASVHYLSIILRTPEEEGVALQESSLGILLQALFDDKLPFIHKLLLRKVDPSTSKVVAYTQSTEIQSRLTSRLARQRIVYKNICKTAIHIYITARVLLFSDAGREDDALPWIPIELRRLVIQQLALSPLMSMNDVNAIIEHASYRRSWLLQPLTRAEFLNRYLTCIYYPIGDPYNAAAPSTTSADAKAVVVAQQQERASIRSEAERVFAEHARLGMLFD